MLLIRTLRLRRFLLMFLAGFILALLWGYGYASLQSQKPPALEADPAAAPAIAAEPLPAADDAIAGFRLARDTEHSRQREELQKLLTGQILEADVRGEAEKELWRLTKMEAAEHEAETILAAEGWSEACVALGAGEATVIVHGRTLDARSAAAIGGLVAEAAGLGEDAVRILEQE